MLLESNSRSNWKAPALALPFLLMIFLCVPWADRSARADASQRLAFVVGIDEYDNLGADQRKLTRAVQDAIDVGASLQDLGFEVVGGVGKNLKRDDFVSKWKVFVDKVKPGRHDTVAIFISGHGMEIEGKNYILAKNAPFKRAGRQGEMERESISLMEMMLDLQPRQPRIVFMILDACRTNPFIPPEYTSATGLGGISITGDGVLTLYSAGGGETALDRLPGLPEDSDPNSVFTRALLPMLKSLKTSPVPLYLTWTQALQKKVREIAASAGRKQSPKAYSGLEGEFCLLGPCPSLSDGPLFQDAVALSELPCGNASFSQLSRLESVGNEAFLLDYITKNRGTPCARAAAYRLRELSGKRSTLRIVVVGTNEYTDPKLPRLLYAASDAASIAETLGRTMGPIYENVKTERLVGAAATKKDILYTFSSLVERAMSTDTVVVYLSGLVLQIDNKAYYIPADGRDGDLSSYVDLGDVQRMISTTLGRRILLLDTCGVELKGSIKETLLEETREKRK